MAVSLPLQRLKEEAIHLSAQPPEFVSFLFSFLLLVFFWLGWEKYPRESWVMIDWMFEGGRSFAKLPVFAPVKPHADGLFMYAVYVSFYLLWIWLKDQNVVPLGEFVYPRVCWDEVVSADCARWCKEHFHGLKWYIIKLQKIKEQRFEMKYLGCQQASAALINQGTRGALMAATFS